MSVYKEKSSTNIYKNSKDYQLLQGDSLLLLKIFKDKSIDMIFADPPYFLSKRGGISCHNGSISDVYKGDWDKTRTLEEKIAFNEVWLKECHRILKDSGTIWISGTMHSIYTIGVLLEKLDFKIMNNIAWYKPNAAPNMTCRFFAHSNETIIWAKKDGSFAKHTFNYELMKQLNKGFQQRDVWFIKTVGMNEKKHGRHPTQKPIELLERIILASTKEGDIILDPFTGSSTTGVAALSNKRKFIGIEKENEYLEISQKRLDSIMLD